MSDRDGRLVLAGMALGWAAWVFAPFFDWPPVVEAGGLAAAVTAAVLIGLDLHRDGLRRIDARYAAALAEIAARSAAADAAVRAAWAEHQGYVRRN